ncbi:MAG: DUF4177 domain-containing protein [Chitinivibrionales bacterium]|nr:DUF4177 domain-containing protein [Chitinivibrionales bacterium]
MLQKWEYIYLIAEKHGKGIFGFVLPKDISWKVHYVNGKQVANWTDHTLFNFLNDLGEKGWEIISSNMHMSIRTGSLPIEHLHLILKRPKSETAK